MGNYLIAQNVSRETISGPKRPMGNYLIGELSHRPKRAMGNYLIAQNARTPETPRGNHVNAQSISGVTISPLKASHRGPLKTSHFRQTKDEDIRIEESAIFV